MTLSMRMIEVQTFIAGTLRKGDAAKWAAYKALPNYEARRDWNRREGHAEFCRLQRLEFHGLLANEEDLLNFGNE